MRAPTALADVVVIGSGFGGSIAACRLAQAGHSVIVLERGRRYRPQDFPRDVTDVDSLLWRPTARPQARGLYDLRFFSPLACVAAAGVGGGSLIYANIHIRPDATIFDDHRWPDDISRGSLDRYYDRVAEMLQIAPVPTSVTLPKRNAFHAAASRLNRAAFDPDQAVHWPDHPSPHVHQEGTCRYCAECEFGCRFGAKRTTDRTYLAEAERFGAQVRPGQLVASIWPHSGGYRVVHRNMDTGASEETWGRRVVIAAGTMGTNELLLNNRDRYRSLPAVSPALGHGFSANGDFIGSIQSAQTPLDPHRGPDVTSVMRFFDQPPEFTLAAPTFNASVMEVLASMGQPSGRALRPIAPLLWAVLPRALPWAMARGLLSRPSPLPAPHKGDWRRSINLFTIGRDNAGGRLHLNHRRGLDVDWDYRTENAALITGMQTAMAQVAHAYGGTFSPNIIWNAFRRILTFHPLGGCRLSADPASGVVSPSGEVHGYPGLFIADGSVVPTSIGFHPVMTISALAERTAEAVAHSI